MLAASLALRLHLGTFAQIIPIVVTVATTDLLDATLRHCTIHIPVIELHVICPVAIVAIDLARIVLAASLALRLHLGTFAQIVSIVVTVATTDLLDAVLRHHAIPITIIELHIESAVPIVPEDLTRIVLCAALASSLHLVARTWRTTPLAW